MSHEPQYSFKKLFSLLNSTMGQPNRYHCPWYWMPRLSSRRCPFVPIPATPSQCWPRLVVLHVEKQYFNHEPTTWQVISRLSIPTGRQFSSDSSNNRLRRQARWKTSPRSQICHGVVHCGDGWMQCAVVG